MKTFKFGMLIEKDDICDREKEINFLKKICFISGGRAVVYGPRRFGKTSVIRNVIMKDFERTKKKSFAICADLFQISSSQDFIHRLKAALEICLSERAKIKTFIANIQNYFKNIRAEISINSQTGSPKVSITGSFEKEDRSISDLFYTIDSLSRDHPVLLILDEFQDIVGVDGLEAILRSEIQKLTRSSVILLGSKQHILKDIFHDEKKPFYGFGTDIEFGPIPRDEWVVYMQERFRPNGQSIDGASSNFICQLMDDVPNAIQELCNWIWISPLKGKIGEGIIRESLAQLINNKSSRFLEKMASLSVKEKQVLHIIAKQQPVTSINSTQFIKDAGTSATGTKAIVNRLLDQGIVDYSIQGYRITDPIFRQFLMTD